MSTRSKLVAHLTDAEALKLDTDATRQILGEHHMLNLAGEFLLICWPPQWDAAQSFLEALGASVFPHLRDSAGVGEAFAGKVKHLAAVENGDSSYAALHKLHAALKWPPLNPRE